MPHIIFPGPTSEQLIQIEEAKAAKESASANLARRREEQLDGSDCALSDRCDGLNRSMADETIRLLSQGGYDVFPGLYDIVTGARVRARLVTRPNRFASWQMETVWIFLNDRGQNRPVRCADDKERWQIAFQGDGALVYAREQVALYEEWLSEPGAHEADLKERLSAAREQVKIEEKRYAMAQKRQAKLGYKEARELAPAKAVIGGSGTGLSGLASAFVTTERTDDGYSGAMPIVYGE